MNDRERAPAHQRWSVWLLLAVAWFATLGWRPLFEPDEGPLRRDSARNAGVGRLGDTAPGRLQVFREAGAPILGDGCGLFRVRRARVDVATVVVRARVFCACR